MDDFRIYKKTLLLDEIDSLYHLGGWATDTDTVDLAIAWTSPSANQPCGTGKEESISVSVTNTGNVDVSQFDISYSIDGGSTFVTEPVTYPLAPGESLAYAFTRKADMSEVRTFHCLAAVYAPGDMVNTNDTVTTDVQNLAISFSLQTSATSCNDSTGGAGITAITGGTAPYSYSWTSGDTTAIANGLAAGVYQVTVTDANGCSTTKTFTISASGGPEIFSSDIHHITCYGGHNGAVDITVFGGASPYTFRWSTGATTEDVTALAAGTYDVTVTDANGCSNTFDFTITQPPRLSLSVETSDATCGNNDGEAEVSVTGGSPAYTYAWSTGSTSSTATQLGGGVYSITVTDAHGCSIQKEVTISETGAPEIVLTGITPAHCGVNDGAIDISASGGAGTYVYSWSTGYSGEDLTGVPPGDYTVTVREAGKNCTSSAIFTVPSVKPDPVPVCMVTVDSITERNMVIWNKPVDQGDIASFNIYREGSVAGEFLLIGNVKYSQESAFIDSVADPAIRSWRYRISTLDGCGNESEPSEPHRTIHLSMNLGVDNTINLGWGAYEGFSYGTYHVWRYAAPDYQREKLADLPAGAGYTTFTDANPPDAGAYYVITVEVPSPCNTSGKIISHNSVRSNRKKTTLAANAIPEETALFHTLTIYPNPSKGTFTIKGGLTHAGNLEIRVFDATGSQVYNRKIYTPDGSFIHTVVLPGSHAGIYMLEFITRGGTTHKVIVVE